jgi:hypothetical protein
MKLKADYISGIFAPMQFITHFLPVCSSRLPNAEIRIYENILSLLYVYGTWFLIFQEEHSLRVFENSMFMT